MSELIDNRERRIQTLKDVVRRLHEGCAAHAVKEQVTELVRECHASEIASMEQGLMADGVSAREIMRMCDLHAEVVRDVLVAPADPVLPAGHPVETFRRENAALGSQVAALRLALAAAAPPEAAEEAPVDRSRALECRRLFNEVMDVDKHYRRKEHLLFSCLERHGISGPSTVMWGKDDQVREALRAAGEALNQEGGRGGSWRALVPDLVEPALRLVEEMIFKEERILLPMALQTLTAGEWGEIWSQTPEFGYCLVEPGLEYQPPGTASGGPGPDAVPGVPAATSSPLGSGALVFSTGSLTLAQLQALFSVLPVDITFVDAEDRVRFFSEGKHRVFARPKAVIGRRVQHCHPPSSVGTVERILDDFRSGRQSVAEFWIEMRGRFVLIRYLAVRDQEGGYLGTLEVTQDLTRERALPGERRLLQYGS